MQDQGYIGKIESFGSVYIVEFEFNEISQFSIPTDRDLWWVVPKNKEIGMMLFSPEFRKDHSINQLSPPRIIAVICSDSVKEPFESREDKRFLEFGPFVTKLSDITYIYVFADDVEFQPPTPPTLQE